MVVENVTPLKGVLFAMYKMILINCVNVCPKHHQVIRFERYFRYLNKAKKMVEADKKSLPTWVLGLEFPLYGWNVSLVDGMQLLWYYAAKVRPPRPCLYLP